MSFEKTERFDSHAMAKDASGVFERMRTVIRDRITVLENMTDDKASNTEISKELKELNRAMLIAVDEQRKMEDAHAKSNGGLTPGAHDLAAARVEIGSRLARLRAAGDSGGVSERVE